MREKQFETWTQNTHQGKGICLFEEYMQINGFSIKTSYRILNVLLL